MPVLLRYAANFMTLVILSSFLISIEVTKQLTVTIQLASLCSVFSHCSTI